MRHCARGPTTSQGNPAGVFPRLDLTSLPAALLNRARPSEPPQVRRTKLWEFGTSLHCSIIGTCLSTQDLRHLLTKLKLAPGGASDHDLHRLAVTLAARHEEPARQIHKALDHRHRLAVSQFTKARSEPALRALWSEALKHGDIPGAYWATLTHPVASQALIREAFGEIHMLSHMVGSANRADLKRLRLLEADKSNLEAKLIRQQTAFHEAVVSRDAQIAALRNSLARQVTGQTVRANDADDEVTALRNLVAHLEKRLSAEIRRRERAEERQAATMADLALTRKAREAAERVGETLQRELRAAETLWHADEPAASPVDGMVVLYVGGRPNQIAHLRRAAEARGLEFLHHDGGVENHVPLLAGLVSRADLVVFPVDCVSHDAMLNLKALCRQAGKPFTPLRTTSVPALLAGLHAFDAARLQDAAD
jgi:hypothetical protein